MLRKLTGKEKMFADGALRRRGDVWPASKPWKYTEAVGGEAPNVVAEEPGRLTRKEMMAQLSAAGVSFAPTMKSAELQALLDDTRREMAPASSSAPAKDFVGTGNQDVI